MPMGAPRDFEFHGHRLASWQAGQGGALLLIHGFPTSSLDWQHVWPSLARQYELHAIDMLGFGLSDKPIDFDYSVAASADQWQALVEARGLKSVSILAHDYGDTVAQELLARQHEDGLSFRIERVAFLNGGLFPEATFPIFVQRMLLGPFGPLVARLSGERRFRGTMRRICGRPLPDEELHEHWQRLVLARGRRVFPRLIRYIRERHLRRDRWVGALEYAGIPLGLIDGTFDPVSGATIVARWRELLPKAMVVELPGIGHYPQWEAPDEVVAACTRFFLAPA
jgi:pimeloyl-ACP methyl ester carboxylesterase